MADTCPQSPPLLTYHPLLIYFKLFLNVPGVCPESLSALVLLLGLTIPKTSPGSYTFVIDSTRCKLAETNVCSTRLGLWRFLNYWGGIVGVYMVRSIPSLSDNVFWD